MDKMDFEGFCIYRRRSRIRGLATFLCAAKPPLRGVTRVFRYTLGNSDSSVVKPPVLSRFEKVRPPIVPLKCTVKVSGEAPFGDWLWILSRVDMWNSLRIKFPIFAALCEVDFVIATPDKSRVNIIRDSWKAGRNKLWIAFDRVMLRYFQYLSPLKM